MSVRTDTVNLIVNVNNNAAQNALNEQKKKFADLKKELAGLKKGTDEWVKKNEEIKKVATDMDVLKKQIGITALSQKELTAELSKLKALRGSVAPFSKEFNDLSKEIKKVESRLYDVKNGVQGFSSFFSKISDQVKQFGMIAAGYLGFQFITGQFQNMLRGAGKLSDQLADLQRVAGLTSFEAETLNQSLSKINTRTSTEGLREIAIIAGKLGVAKKDILDFTKATDMLVVSLGDELGDAGDITDKLGKILNVFDGKITGDNISKLGNAFVELANTGASSGGFIADFDQRLSGIAKSANIGLGELSGLGAGLEELGGRVESSSTAIQKLIISISSDIPKAAKIAGMDVKEFNKLFANDPTEALLRYSEGLVKNKQSFSEVTSAFKDAGEEGARTIETIAKLGTNSDELRKRIDLGKKAIQDNTAITEAFNLKNETFGATLDKIGKEFNKLVASSSFTNFLKGLAQGFLNLISPSQSLYESFKKQAELVKKLDTDISPLIRRYEELKAKSTLNKDEQVELNKAIQTIGNTIPGAISQFDKYGNALAINADKARQFIELQRSILKEKNRDTIKEQENLLKKLNADAEAYQRLLNVGQTEVRMSGGSGGGSSYMRKLTDEEIRATQNTLAQLQDRIKGVNGIIDELKGTNIKSPDPIKTTKQNAAELNTLTEEQKKAADAAAKQQQDEFARLKKEADKFYKELSEIKRKAVIKGEDPEQAEIDAAAAKYAKLSEELKNFYVKHALTKTQFNTGDKLLEEAHQQELNNIFQKYYKKRFDELSQNEYDQSLADRKEYADQLKIQAAKDFADGKISQLQYSNEIKRIDRDETADRILIAEDYADTVKKAATDVKNFKKAQEKQITDDAIAEAELRKKSAQENALYAAQRKVLTSRPGTPENVNAQAELLKLQFEQETEFLDKKSELYLLKEAELQNALQDLRKQNQQRQIDQIFEYVGIFQNALDGLEKFIANRENAQLARDKAANETKKNNYRKQQTDRLISKEFADRKITQLDEEQDKRERALRRKQAEREKALNLFNAFVNNTQAILKTMASVPYPFNIPLAIAQGIAGGIQVAAIANADIPSLGTGDWVRTGDKHSAASGGINAKIERDEAVINASAMTDTDVVTVTGTTAQITSALNSRKGGKSWAPGAVVEMPGWRTQMPKQINQDMPRILEQGGVVRPLFQDAAAAQTNALLQSLLAEQVRNTEEVAALKWNIKTVFSIKEFNRINDLYNAAKTASGQ